MKKPIAFEKLGTALWFMVSGVAVGWFIRLYQDPPNMDWGLVAFCSAAAGVWGALLGYPIWKRSSNCTALGASIRGLGIAGLSIVSSFFLLALLVSIMTGDPQGFFVALLFSLPMAGQAWPALPFGLFSGWSLYYLRRALR